MGEKKMELGHLNHVM